MKQSRRLQPPNSNSDWTRATIFKSLTCAKSFEVAVRRFRKRFTYPWVIVSRMAEIDPSRETVVHYKGGVRSARAIGPSNDRDLTAS